MKDTQIHDMNYLLKQSEDKLLYYQDKLKALEKELERFRCDSSPQTSEEHTADLRKMYDEELIKSLDVKYHDLSTDHLHSMSHQDISRLELNENMHALEESILMLSEDYLALADKHQISCENYEIKIGHLLDDVESLKAWKANQVDYKYEFDQIKIVNDWYVRELESMLNAKEEIIKKYTEEKDKNIQQSTIISSLQTQLTSLSSRIPILEQEIQDLTYHNHFKPSLESDLKESEKYTSKIQELEKDKIRLTSELSFLQSTLKQRELDLSLSQIETSKQLSSLQEEHKNFLIQAREDRNQAVQILSKQTQDALEQLQRERDDLVKELKEYRSSSLEGLQNILHKSESEVYRKYRKARRVLAERDKEILYLKKSKEDLKEAYEKAQKSLKAVMKTIGTETQRLNSRLLH
jgi:DNA repair exonuclease SbcCD ATPase subunit